MKYILPDDSCVSLGKYIMRTSLTISDQDARQWQTLAELTCSYTGFPSCQIGQNQSDGICGDCSCSCCHDSYGSCDMSATFGCKIDCAHRCDRELSELGAWFQLDIVKSLVVSVNSCLDCISTLPFGKHHGRLIDRRLDYNESILYAASPRCESCKGAWHTILSIDVRS